MGEKGTGGRTDKLLSEDLSFHFVAKRTISKDHCISKQWHQKRPPM
jgi:hypothetical protein